MVTRCCLQGKILRPPIIRHNLIINFHRVLLIALYTVSVVATSKFIVSKFLTALTL